METEAFESPIRRKFVPTNHLFTDTPILEPTATSSRKGILYLYRWIQKCADSSKSGTKIIEENFHGGGQDGRISKFEREVPYSTLTHFPLGRSLQVLYTSCNGRNFGMNFCRFYNLTFTKIY